MVGTFFGLAALYMMLYAHFLAIIQMLVYAGAIMVLFLFVLMLLRVQPEERPGSGRSLRAAALALVALLVLQVGAVLLAAGIQPGEPRFEASTREVAHQLFSTPFLYVFEATSILILAALVGAVVLAKKEL